MARLDQEDVQLLNTAIEGSIIKAMYPFQERLVKLDITVNGEQGRGGLVESREKTESQLDKLNSRITRLQVRDGIIQGGLAVLIFFKDKIFH
jgi:hypothetical protein